MRARGYRSIFLFGLIGLVASCSSTTPSGTGSGNFTATIDGSAWAAAAASITVTPSTSVPGSVVISGTQISGTTNTTSISLELGYLMTNTTYPLGVNELTTAGGTAIVSSTSTSVASSWTTGFSGAAGTITLTDLTATHIAGKFTFTAVPNVGTTGGNKSVTNGQFDLNMTGFVAATSANPGSTMKATVGGTPFNGATISGQGSGGVFSLLGATSDPIGTNLTSISLVTTQPVVAGTTYPLIPQNGGPSISVRVTVGSTTYGGGIGNDSGSVTVTNVSGGRASGSFSGTLFGTNGTSIVVSGGTFDVKTQ